MKHAWVTASEIGDFVYCKRGWWLRFNDFVTKPSADMLRGTAHHNRLVIQLETHPRKLLIASVIIGIGVALLLVCWLLYSLLHSL